MARFPAWRPVAALLCLALLGGCSLSNLRHSAVGFLGSYESALRAYQSGDIMAARKIVLRMDPSRPDYADARKLLKRKIEPARLRLLRHYAAAARRAEKAGQWYRARTLYEQAAGFSTSPKALLDKARRMDVRMRQIRLERLIAIRRKDDAHLLALLDQFDAPKGLSPKDEPFARAREAIEDRVLARARQAWLAAKRALREGYPEVAYVEAESFHRLRPDAEKGKRLLDEVRKALPKGLRIPPMRKAERPTHRIKPPRTVTAKTIRDLIRKGDWLKARRYALIYQREDGKGADRYLAIIEKKMKAEAAQAFKAGRIAFRLEKLDKAVEHWKRAVALQPRNAEYVQSLNRALQMQERLRLLRGESREEAGQQGAAPGQPAARTHGKSAGKASGKRATGAAKPAPGH